MSHILVTGANGQIGSELVEVLRERHGPAGVVRLDLKPPPSPNGQPPDAPFEVADVRDREVLADVIARHEIDTVYHLASLLSATGEQQPDRAWDVNMGGLKNILDLAQTHDLQVFWPSSIAVFGPSTPKTDTPQNTVLDPATMYGVTKRSGELLCQYYHRRYDLDVRSLRYPGLISYKTAPGGGTTDYAVDMCTRAAEGADYSCFLERDARLPMMYMPDAIRATLNLMGADPAALSVRDSYNVAAFSFSPEELAASLRRHVPGFSCTYEPDKRQRIADAWPSTVDDTAARTDWGWAPEYDLDAMTEDMLSHLRTGERVSGGEGA
ncbi:MAG: NAD-dependent epimerase/dehydratase family protein [Salinibacter sp.]